MRPSPQEDKVTCWLDRLSLYLVCKHTFLLLPAGAIETFESDKEVYLVMRLCTGGDLHRRAPYAEAAVVDIITKVKPD